VFLCLTEDSRTAEHLNKDQFTLQQWGVFCVFAGAVPTTVSEYSKALILKTVNYFERKYGVLLSDEQVTTYLDSYAQLYHFTLPAGPDGLPSPDEGQDGRAAGAS